MIDCDEVESDRIAQWHYVNMSHLTDKAHYDMIVWLQKQEGGKFYWTLIKGFWFERAEDRMLCELSWK
jgi:hypothetical protein